MVLVGAWSKGHFLFGAVLTLHAERLCVLCPNALLHNPSMISHITKHFHHLLSYLRKRGRG